MSGVQESGFLTDRPLMTMRVSRDSGRTWGSERAVFATDDLPPLLTSEWPPCQCPRCMGRGGFSNR
ncbi:hypothetical protein StrepF001_20390 [Streptomyces sp. F001]|nr:hypothetical protein StrepF001_20390 [Streptomyces sp. F001]